MIFPLDESPVDGWLRSGVVIGAAAGSIALRIPGCALGSIVVVQTRSGPALARVSAIETGVTRCAPLDSRAEIAPGDRASSVGARLGAYAGSGLLGSAVDGWGRLVSGSAPHADVVRADLAPPAPAERSIISRVMPTGVSAIDAFATIGFGQRIALFAGAGVGKSTLVRRILTAAPADARVLALVGERGREARETIEALQRSDVWRSTTVVCAPAGSPALERVWALQTATAQAEWLCRRGRDVLLIVDSITRAAHALRELAIAGGEPLSNHGYPASVTANLASIVERAGARRIGSVTAVYAVLVDGDDLREPVSDAVRGMLDGHIVLDRGLADAGRYPAIDVLRSLSRLAPELTTHEHRRDAAVARRALDALDRAQDLLAIGAYRPGGDALLDASLAARPLLEALIFDGDGRRDGPDIAARLHQAVAGLHACAA
ncbi:MAG TPA: EscN/YscN/HrcN family type III secretion system ATPase [Candidatus Eremiobacteraceae bacterium]